MTVLNDVLAGLVERRKALQDSVEEDTQDLVGITAHINELYAEIADLDKSIESIQRVLNDGTRPTFNI